MHVDGRSPPIINDTLSPPIPAPAEHRVATPGEAKIYKSAVSILNSGAPNVDKLAKIMQKNHVSLENLEGLLEAHLQDLNIANAPSEKQEKVKKALDNLRDNKPEIDQAGVRAEAQARVKALESGRPLDGADGVDATNRTASAPTDKAAKREKMKSVAGKVVLWATAALMIGIGIGLLASPAAPAAIPFLIGGFIFLGLAIADPDGDKSKARTGAQRGSTDRQNTAEAEGQNADPTRRTTGRETSYRPLATIKNELEQATHEQEALRNELSRLPRSEKDTRTLDREMMDIDEELKAAEGPTSTKTREEINQIQVRLDAKIQEKQDTVSLGAKKTEIEGKISALETKKSGLVEEQGRTRRHEIDTAAQQSIREEQRKPEVILKQFEPNRLSDSVSPGVKEQYTVLHDQAKTQLEAAHQELNTVLSDSTATPQAKQDAENKFNESVNPILAPLRDFQITHVEPSIIKGELAVLYNTIQGFQSEYLEATMVNNNEMATKAQAKIDAGFARHKALDKLLLLIPERREIQSSHPITNSQESRLLVLNREITALQQTPPPAPTRSDFKSPILIEIDNLTAEITATPASPIKGMLTSRQAILREIKANLDARKSLGMNDPRLPALNGDYDGMVDRLGDVDRQIAAERGHVSSPSARTTTPISGPTVNVYASSSPRAQQVNYAARLSQIAGESAALGRKLRSSDDADKSLIMQKMAEKDAEYTKFTILANVEAAKTPEAAGKVIVEALNHNLKADDVPDLMKAVKQKFPDQSSALGSTLYHQLLRSIQSDTPEFAKLRNNPATLAILTKLEESDSAIGIQNPSLDASSTIREQLRPKLTRLQTPEPRAGTAPPTGRPTPRTNQSQTLAAEKPSTPTPPNVRPSRPLPPPPSARVIAGPVPHRTTPTPSPQTSNPVNLANVEAGNVNAPKSTVNASPASKVMNEVLSTEESHVKGLKGAIAGMTELLRLGEGRLTDDQKKTINTGIANFKNLLLAHSKVIEQLNNAKDLPDEERAKATAEALKSDAFKECVALSKEIVLNQPSLLKATAAAENKLKPEEKGRPTIEAKPAQVKGQGSLFDRAASPAQAGSGYAKILSEQGGIEGSKIDALLYKPFQRMGKYPLLARDLHSQLPPAVAKTSGIDQLTISLNETMSALNEAQRSAEARVAEQQAQSLAVNDPKAIETIFLNYPRITNAEDYVNILKDGIQYLSPRGLAQLTAKLDEKLADSPQIKADGRAAFLASMDPNIPQKSQGIGSRLRGIITKPKEDTTAADRKALRSKPAVHEVLKSWSNEILELGRDSPVYMSFSRAISDQPELAKAINSAYTEAKLPKAATQETNSTQTTPEAQPLTSGPSLTAAPVLTENEAKWVKDLMLSYEGLEQIVPEDENQWADAINYLNELNVQYPGNEQIQTASSRLNELLQRGLPEQTEEHPAVVPQANIDELIEEASEVKTEVNPATLSQPNVNEVVFPRLTPSSDDDDYDYNEWNDHMEYHFKMAQTLDLENMTDEQATALSQFKQDLDKYDIYKDVSKSLSHIWEELDRRESQFSSEDTSSGSESEPPSLRSSTSSFVNTDDERQESTDFKEGAAPNLSNEVKEEEEAPVANPMQEAMIAQRAKLKSATPNVGQSANGSTSSTPLDAKSTTPPTAQAKAKESDKVPEGWITNFGIFKDDVNAKIRMVKGQLNRETIEPEEERALQAQLEALQAEKVEAEKAQKSGPGSVT